MKTKVQNALKKARKEAVSAGLKGALNGLSLAGHLHPGTKHLKTKVDVYRNIPYNETRKRSHTLDVYRPQGVPGPLPVVVYIHGGGFIMLSKDTHWMMAYEFAHMGCLVITINYRLAPQHQFPRALHDIAEALEWVKNNAERYGGDLSRLAYAGESAGANLALTSVICDSWKREESFAQYIWDLELRPKVVLPACGILQVSEPDRYLHDDSIPLWMRDRIAKVCHNYVDWKTASEEEAALASPLAFIEQAGPPDRSFPAALVTCGTSDPILKDSVRLSAAFARLGFEFEYKEYPDAIHAFHAFIWKDSAIECWDDHENFLREKQFITA